jgi:hypothetical protein
MAVLLIFFSIFEKKERSGMITLQQDGKTGTKRKTESY